MCGGCASDNVRTLDGAMCAVVIMCVGLVLLGTGTGGHVLMNADRTLNGSTGDQQLSAIECLEKCASRCHIVVVNDLPCCSCISLCAKMCGEYKKVQSSTALTQEETKSTSYPGSQGVPCAKDKCGLPGVGWKSLLVACGHCRVRRRSRSPLMREAALIARSVGLELGNLEGTPAKKDPPGSDKTLKEIQIPARVESVVRGDDMISVRISWDPRPRVNVWYIVSWEPEGGGVRGNLLTNSTSISLSMLPETLYHVQVSSGSDQSVSECLEVDTHSPPPSQRRVIHSRVEEFGGIAAAIVVFLTVFILLGRKWCFNTSTSSKHVAQLRDFDHFKLYPPPVTLFKHPPPAKQLPV